MLEKELSDLKAVQVVEGDHDAQPELPPAVPPEVHAVHEPPDHEVHEPACEFYSMANPVEMCEEVRFHALGALAQQVREQTRELSEKYYSADELPRFQASSLAVDVVDHHIVQRCASLVKALAREFDFFMVVASSVDPDSLDEGEEFSDQFEQYRIAEELHESASQLLPFSRRGLISVDALVTCLAIYIPGSHKIQIAEWVHSFSGDAQEVSVFGWALFCAFGC